MLFFPTKVGAKWTYQHPLGEEARVVIAVERKGAACVVSVGQVGGDGRAYTVEQVEVSAAGLSRVSSVVVTTTTLPGGGTTTTREAVADAPPYCLLKLQARVGERWQRPHPSGQPVTATVGREEMVRVPAGSFEAVPVDYVLAGPPGMPAIRARHWYSRGVGVVKRMDRGYEVVLKTFSPGRD